MPLGQGPAPHSRSWRWPFATALICLGLVVLTVWLGGDEEDPLPRWRAARLALAAAGERGPADIDRSPPAWEDPDPDPRTAVRQTVLDNQLRQEQASQRHPSDGQGRAWLANEDDPLSVGFVGEPGRWEVVYEAGPLGIAEGGAVYLMASPFWNWSTPQVERPDLAGYTEVATEAQGIALECETVTPILLRIRIAGRALAEGEQIRLVYGAGPAGAIADRYAERFSRLWIAVDGDGDDLHGVLLTSPTVAVLPGSPELLVMTLPTTAQVGDEVELTLALLDGQGNAGVWFEGRLELAPSPPGLEYEPEVELETQDRGRVAIPVRITAEGIYRVQALALATDGERLEIDRTSNPLVVDAAAPRVLWGDLHGHSQLSDGTGTAADYYAYARDVAALDVAVLTDHDHWGVRLMDENPEIWDLIRNTARGFHEPGRFVALSGFEWTSWIHGHRHVVYFDDGGEIYSSFDANTTTPAQLWQRLRGQSALTFAHHSAGGPIACNWSYLPDPVLEPLTEISSVHGVSEALDSPGRLYSPLQGNFVRDQLDRGLRVGFVGSGDSHDGHPGLVHIAGAGKGGLAAIFSEELTREGVLEACRARRAYATNGSRIFLDAVLAGRSMGADVPAAELEGGRAELLVRAVGTAPFRRLELIRSGEVVLEREFDGEEQRELALALDLEGLEPGEYVYLRLVQRDRGAAWSSPFFIR